MHTNKDLIRPSENIFSDGLSLKLFTSLTFTVTSSIWKMKL